jgi:hypothetical protein
MRDSGNAPAAPKNRNFKGFDRRVRIRQRTVETARGAAQGGAAIFQARLLCLKNEAKRKPRFSLCGLRSGTGMCRLRSRGRKKSMDGLFQLFKAISCA